MLPRVLLLTDDAAIVELARSLGDGPSAPSMHLERAGDVQEGLSRLARDTFHVVLLDLQLPDAGGVAALMSIKEAAPEVTVIVLLAAKKLDLLASAMTSGAEDYLIKEVLDSSLLLRCLRHALEMRVIREALAESEHRYIQLWDRSGVGLLQVDVQGRPIRANRPLGQMLELDADKHGSAADLGEILFSEHSSYERWFEAMRASEQGGGILRVRTKRARDVELLAAGGRTHDKFGRLVGYQLTLLEASTARGYLPEPSYADSHDALSGLYNERMLLDRLRSVPPSRASSSAEYVAVIHLPGLRKAVDDCGRAGADECIRQLAGTLLELTGRDELLARLDNGDFACVFEAGSTFAAWRVGKRLLTAVRRLEFRWVGRLVLRFDASIGIARVDGSGVDGESALAAAEDAARSTQTCKEGCIRMAERPARVDRRARELQRIAETKAAIRDQRLYLSHSSLKPMGGSSSRDHFVELSVRMVEEGGSPRDPSLFFADVERYNLGTTVDRWVVRRAARWLREKGGERRPVCLVSLFAQSVEEPAFLDEMACVIETMRVPAEMFCLAVNERVVVERPTVATRFIRALRLLGCRIAVSGVGGSGLPFAHLACLDVDWLKLDKSLAAAVEIDAVSRVAVRSIVEMSRVMGARTLAPYVEADGALFLLEGLGVDYVQGSGVAAPLLLDETR